MSKLNILDNISSIHHVFEREAASNPSRIALRHASLNLTYGSLNARANFLANHLRDNGVERGEIVALAMSRSIEVFVSILAILKSGGAYFPIDEKNPILRNQICLDQAGVNLIISDRQCDELCVGKRRYISTQDTSLFNSEVETNPCLITSPNDLAYIMFTSGSTGLPKGVRIPHRAVVRLVNNPNYIQIDSEDTFLQLSPLSFDASTFELWGALLNGATLALYSSAILDPHILKANICDNNVTIVWLTAALFHIVGDRYCHALGPVRVLLAGGDVLQPKIVNNVLDKLPGITVINGYGPTENTTFTCCHRMTDDNRPRDFVPIGKAISGTRIHILDEFRNDVPNGEVGELYTSGQGVALGYLEGIDHDTPFLRDTRLSGGLVYRTGDMVRRNSEHDVEFLGRKDNQVKVRGFRVALEEIYLSIMKMPEVRDSIIFLKEDEPGDQILTACLQIREGYNVSEKSVRTFLSAELPRYMVPDRIIVGVDLPVGSNGKLDRGAVQVAYE